MGVPLVNNIGLLDESQWLFSFYQVIEDEKEEVEKQKSFINAIRWYIDPELARHVEEAEKNKIVSTDFEQQIIQTMRKDGASEIEIQSVLEQLKEKK